jgi:CO/xanthine dehydrogenase Mo-binding subunit
MGAATMIGARIRRLEDPRLLRGKGSYVDDISLPGMHAALVRSPLRPCAHKKERPRCGQAGQSGDAAPSVLRFAHRELFDKLGMEHVTLEFDGAGTPIGSSHMWPRGVIGRVSASST